jgi:FkbM family methyltransferase
MTETNDSHAVDAQIIPKIIHFVVPNELSCEQSEAIKRASDAHPGWTIRIWDDTTDLPDFPLNRYLPKRRSGAQFSDLVRLGVVYREGGIYLDADMIVLRPLDPLAKSVSFFIASEDGHNATNAIFAAAPQHPALGSIIEFLDRNEPDWDLPPNVTTGPVLFGKLLRWRSDVKVYPRETFYPYHNWFLVKRPHELSYCEHKWAGSWVEKKIPSATTQRRKISLSPVDLLRRATRPLLNTMARAVANHTRVDLHPSYPVTTKMVVGTVHGHQIVASGSDYSITPKLVRDGYFEIASERFVAKTICGGDWFIDVGANIGVFSMIAARNCGPFGRVFAFEPNPSIAELLRETVALNWVHDRVSVKAIAVSDESANAILQVLNNRSGDARILDKDHNNDEPGAFTKTRDYLPKETMFEVQVDKLDNLFPVDLPIKIIKIDAEGYEGKIMAGAKRLLAARVFDYIIVEAIMDTGVKRWEDTYRWLNMLGQCGYGVGIADEGGNIVECGSLGKALDKMKENNLIFYARR